MKSLRSVQNTARRCILGSPPGLGWAPRALPDAGRPGRTPAGAREGPVLGRGAAGRGSGGPSSLAKCQAHPRLQPRPDQTWREPSRGPAPQGPVPQTAPSPGGWRRARGPGVRGHRLQRRPGGPRGAGPGALRGARPSPGPPRGQGGDRPPGEAGTCAALGSAAGPLRRADEPDLPQGNRRRFSLSLALQAAIIGQLAPPPPRPSRQRPARAPVLRGLTPRRPGPAPSGFP